MFLPKLHQGHEKKYEFIRSSDILGISVIFGGLKNIRKMITREFYF